MDNYLQDIENKYSEIRGQASLLSPKDWNLALTWETLGIPLRVVLRAMSDVQKNFNREKRSDRINSLSYFTQAVEREFAEFSKSQIGKTAESEVEEKPMTENIKVSDDFVEHIEREYLPKYDCERFADTDIELSELMCKAISKVRSELIILVENINQKSPATSEIEKSLSAIKSEFEIALIADFTDEQRQQLIDQTKAEHPKYEHLPDVLQSFLIRKCYTSFGLPELNLFVF